MTDLSTKFETLQGQLLGQHTALMSVLSGIADKLDAIALAVQPQPETGPTLADVVAALGVIATNQDAQTPLLDNVSNQAGYIASTVGDIHLDTMSMDQKLLTMRDAIADILTEALNITSATRATHDRLVDNLDALAALRSATGTPTGDATTTVLGYLSSLAYSNGRLVTGQQELIDCGCDNSGEIIGECNDPVRSSGMWLAPYGVFGFENFIVATWASLPEGLEYGSIFGLEEDIAEVYNNDWSGWRVYVQSTEPQYADGMNTNRYDTNVWRDLPPGAASYSWSVNVKGSLQVILCPPPEPTNKPEGAMGWYGLNDTVPNNGGLFEPTLNALIMDNIGVETMAPNPIEAVGSTLYFRYCFNETPATNKNIYLAYDGTSESSIFHELTPGSTYAWTVENVPSLRMWVHGRPFNAAFANVKVVYAWSVEELDHC